MYIAALCEDYRVLSVIYILKIVIKIVCIVVPIILIVSLMIGLMNHVMKGEGKNGFGDVTKGMVNKIISAIVVFLVPNIINVVVSIIGFNGASDCYNNANREYIDLKKSEYDSKKEKSYQEALSEIQNAFNSMLENNGSNNNGNSNVTGKGSTKMVQIAQSELGNVGGEKYRTWYYGRQQSAQWCAIFVSWVANEAGYLNTSIPKFALCSSGANWFKSQGRWQDGNYTPSPGDIIFFDWKNSRDGVPDHVGIVESVSSGNVTYISGNDDDVCKRNTYPIGYDSIYGYGVPNY